MKGLQDPQCQAKLEQLFQLDWTGFDVWAVGGIVSDWETSDIDLVLLGEYDEPRIVDLLLATRTIGQIDMYYTQDPRFHRHDAIYRDKLKVANVKHDKLEWNTLLFPTVKYRLKKKQGLYYKEPVQLIQNGVQIYL